MTPAAYLTSAAALPHATQGERIQYAAAPKAENARGLAALLLAAAVAALAVVADQLIDTWADNHLFLAWTIMWTVVFAGSLLLTGTARRMSLRAMARLDQWASNRAQARAEARIVAMARRDSRLLAREHAPMTASRSRAERTLASHLFHI